MVDRQWPRRLRRRDDRGNADATLSRSADRAGRPSAWPAAGARQGGRHTAGRRRVPTRCSPTAGAAARSCRQDISTSKASISTIRFRFGCLPLVAGGSRHGSGWSQAGTRPGSVGCLHPWGVTRPASRCASRCSPTIATITARPGKTGSSRLLSATGDTLRVADGTRSTLRLRADGRPDHAAARLVSRFRSAD